MDKATLLQYWELLNRHDWYYEMSDDIRVDRNGGTSYRNIVVISQQSPEHTKMFAAFESHYFSGKPWNNQQSSKPEKPLTDSVNLDTMVSKDKTF